MVWVFDLDASRDTRAAILIVGFLASVAASWLIYFWVRKQSG